MKIRIALAAAGLAAGLGMAAPSQAGVVFSDNFNSYSSHCQLNWTPPSNWSVASGSVDLIGSFGSAKCFNVFPGNGAYVDLNGTTHTPGALETLANFAAGTYTLTFDLGGSQRHDASKTTDISLGNWSTSITLPATAGLTLYTFTFTTTGGQLEFADLTGGNPNIGNILDNVTLSAIPEPMSWALLLLGMAGVGAGLRMRRGTSARAVAAG